MDEKQLVDRDEEHLRLLSFFSYIFAGLHALLCFFPLIYVALGLLFWNMPASEFNKGSNPKDHVSPHLMGGILIGAGAFIFLLILLYALASFFSGRWIKQRKHRWFSLMMAGFHCLIIPYGTILGVFTFIVLTRLAVKEMFNKPSTGTPKLHNDCNLNSLS